MDNFIHPTMQFIQSIPTSIKSIHPLIHSFQSLLSQFRWDILKKSTEFFSLYNFHEANKPESWANFKEIENMFKDTGKLRRPMALNEDWTTDQHFARQRLRGLNADSLKLCKQLPENLDATPEVLNVSC